MKRAARIPVAVTLSILLVSTYVGVATVISGRGDAWDLFIFGFGISAAAMASGVFLIGSIILLINWVEV